MPRCWKRPRRCPPGRAGRCTTSARDTWARSWKSPSATQPLLTVRRAEGGEALIPLVDEFIVDVDEDGRRIDVSLPAGLLDL